MTGTPSFGPGSADPWTALLRRIFLTSWTEEERNAAGRIAQAKHSGSEARYLRPMQMHARLRAAFLKLGSGG